MGLITTTEVAVCIKMYDFLLCCMWVNKTGAKGTRLSRSPSSSLSRRHALKTLRAQPSIWREYYMRFPSRWCDMESKGERQETRLMSRPCIHTAAWNWRTTLTSPTREVIDILFLLQKNCCMAASRIIKATVRMVMQRNVDIFSLRSTKLHV